MKLHEYNISVCVCVCLCWLECPNKGQPKQKRKIEGANDGKRLGILKTMVEKVSVEGTEHPSHTTDFFR